MQNCFECDFNISTIYCADCKYNLCVTCNYQKHLSSKNRISMESGKLSKVMKDRNKKYKTHKYHLACEECEINKREFYCPECEESFCNACFEVFHKRGKRKKHEKQAISEEAKYSILMNVIFYDAKQDREEKLKNLLIDYMVNYKQMVRYTIIVVSEETDLLKRVEEASYFSLVNVEDKRIYTDLGVFIGHCGKILQKEYYVNRVHFLFDCSEKHIDYLKKSFKELKIHNDDSFVTNDGTSLNESFETNLNASLKTTVLRKTLLKQDSKTEISRARRKKKRENQKVFKCYSSNNDNKMSLIKSIGRGSKLSYFLENSESSYLSKPNFDYPLFHIYNDIEFESESFKHYSLIIQKLLHEEALRGNTKIIYDKFVLSLQSKHQIPIPKIQTILSIAVRSNIIYKQVRQFSKFHTLTFLSLKTSFQFSLENLLWVIKALKKDKMSFSIINIVNRIKDIFDLSFDEDVLYGIFDDFIKYKENNGDDIIFKCLDIEKGDKDEYQINYIANDSYLSDFLEDEEVIYNDFDDVMSVDEECEYFKEFRRFIDYVFTLDLICIELENSGKEKDLKSKIKRTSSIHMNRSIIDNITVPQGKNLIVDRVMKEKGKGKSNSLAYSLKPPPRNVKKVSSFKKTETKLDSDNLIKNEEVKVIPGGKYGLALFTKYYGFRSLKECSIGMITNFIDKAVKLNILKYKKTFIYKCEEESNKDEDSALFFEKQEKLGLFRETLLTVLEKHNWKINLAQAKELIEKTGKLRIRDFQQYGYHKLKDILEEFSNIFKIIEVKKGTFILTKVSMAEQIQKEDNVNPKKAKNKKNKKKKKKKDTSFLTRPKQILKQSHTLDDSFFKEECSLLNITNIQDYLKKVKTEIFKILNLSKNGLEPENLNAHLNEKLGVTFNAQNLGYTNFYEFVVREFYQFIDIEVKFINSFESKILIYLKNRKFGFYKNDNYEIKQQKQDIDSNKLMTNENLLVRNTSEEINQRFLENLLNENVYENSHTGENPSGRQFSLFNIQLPISSKTINTMTNLGKTQRNSSKKLLNLHSLDKKVMIKENTEEAIESFCTNKLEDSDNKIRIYNYGSEYVS